MTTPGLWTGLGLIGALNARISGGLPREVGGISIDTRTLEKGDLFFAIKGDTLDGHDFVRAALEKGAGAAVIDEAHASQFAGVGPLFIVRNVQDSLERLGARARERTNAFIAAVTGSVGKTTTKDMTAAMLARFGAAHCSLASYNNHWGAPLSLARMPAATRFGVFELGMNHAGELAALTAQVRPHVAVVTTVAPVHLEHFDSIEAIADAKAEIFSGLIEGGVAILNRDDATYDRLFQAAAPRAAHVLTFGEHESASARLFSYRTEGDTGVVEAGILGRAVSYRIGAPGRHVAMDSLAALLIATVFDLDVEAAAATLADFAPPKGRGERHRITLADGGEILLLDESYNANPTSMRAALRLLADTAPAPGGRRIAVLGDMLELGPRGGELHAELAEDVEKAGVDQLFTAGRLSAQLAYAVSDARRGAHRAGADELVDVVLAALRPGDVVMVKSSNGTRLSRVAAAIKSLAAPAKA